MQESNGDDRDDFDAHTTCPMPTLFKEWQTEVRKGLSSVAQLDDRMNGLEMAQAELVTHARHFGQLPIISQGLAALNIELQTTRRDLLEPATSKRQIPIETFNMTLKWSAVCIIALIFALIFVLTGQHFGLLDFFSKGK